MSIRRQLTTFAAGAAALTMVITGAVAASPSHTAHAQDQTGTALARTITVVGEGTVTIQPDVAQIQIGVDMTGDTVSEASSEASNTMDAILAALAKIKVASKDFQTSGFSIYVERPPLPDGRPSDTVIYHVNNTVSVTLRDLNQVGAVLEAVIDAGANNIYGVNFSVDDPSEVMTQARRKAAEDALARAQELAALHGVTLGEVVSISEVISGYAVPLAAANLRMEAAGGAGPISPGEMKLTAQLQVVYGIGGKAAASAGSTAAITDTTTRPVAAVEPSVAVTDTDLMTDTVMMTETAAMTDTAVMTETAAMTDTTATGPIAGIEELAGSSGLLRSLTVVGQGSVSITPDIAQIQLGVEVSGDSAKQASTEAAKIMNAILAALDKQGVAKKDIQTSNYSIFVDRSVMNPEGEGNAVVTYRVNNMVTATIRKLDQVGAVLEAVIDAGANNVYGVSFSVDNPDAVMRQARQKAAADARARAEELAALHGVTLGEVISVSEVVTGGYVPMMGGGGAPAAMDVASATVVPGETQMAAQLQVIYAITGPADK